MQRKIKINCFKMTKEGDLMVIFNNGTLWFPYEDAQNDKDRFIRACNLIEDIQVNKIELEDNT